jgi:hypothetical protein
MKRLALQWNHQSGYLSFCIGWPSLCFAGMYFWMDQCNCSHFGYIIDINPTHSGISNIVQYAISYCSLPPA